MNVQIFNQIEFIQAIKSFFKNLNVPMNSVSDEPTTAKDILQDFYKDNSTFQLIDDVYFAGMIDDAAFGENQSLEPDKIKSDYDGILVFGIILNECLNELLPTRSQLAEITRAFNRAFYFTPVVVIFKYGNHLAFANTERLKFKQVWREGEKAGKVSLLRDINIEKTHSGHERILAELRIPTSGTKKVDSFSKLYTYWQEVFSVSLLNKKFYQELSTWFFWATTHVVFPGEPSNEVAYLKKAKLEDLIQEHRATNVIRMLTRLLFVWFIKEKKLIPEELFDLGTLQKEILKEIHPYHENGIFKERNKESVYYKAILQNLFFATLNCPIEGDSIDKRKRGFRGDGYGTHRGIDYLMRYKQYFKNSDAFLEKVNAVVPFLNGGLFECLDDKFNNIYIDGFSDQMVKGEQLIVPDYLFFGLEEEADLSDIVGIKDKKYKKAAVKGLINILKSYKFTITENTPIEEDVALEPELLGKVFENLLASYNPETKTTARKQTGSFYTPREIVNYMVDESLIAYLKNAIKDWKGIDYDSLDDELHILTSFDSKVPFGDYPDLQKEIISVLGTCTILDPACGSGAFPMGILQKMVHILQKLDPKNTIWKEIQLEKARKESDAAFDIEDKQTREERLLEINEAFDQSINDSDYARKLFLIENCIYGVDIQPIATQISKLRFFISLVIEQKLNAEKDNFGIRPLPNLETKFVAANTLIALDKPKEGDQLKIGSDNQKVDTLKKELAATRHKLFSARTKDTKLKYRENDAKLRATIANELKENFGWSNDTAEKLAKWDPYDQNVSSPFFDSEWMFDNKDGFNIVIGNPPYGAKLSKEEKIYIKKNYDSMEGDFESYTYFIEKGFKIISNKGILCYIIPNTFLMQWFSGKIRELILERKILQIIDLGFGIFESAVVPTAILLTENDFSENNLTKFKNQNDKPFQGSFNEIKQIDFLKMPKNQINLKLTPINLNIYNHLLHDSLPLGEVTEIKIGIECTPEFISENNDNEFHKPLVRGRNFDRFIVDFESDPKYVFYKRELLHRPREERLFIAEEKILIRQTGDKIVAAIDSQKLYAWKSVFVLLPKNNLLKLKYILSLLNSKLINYYYDLIVGESGRTFAQVKGVNLDRLPVKICEKIVQNQCSFLVDCIILLKQMGKTSRIFEDILDALVFNIYFTDHMKERGIDVLELVKEDINDLIQGKIFEELNDNEKEKVIEQLTTIWSHPDNEVNNRIKLFAVRSPEILKPILEN